MGLSFTLNGVSFAALSSSNGKYALRFDAPPFAQFMRYKMYGVKGSLTNFGDLIGYTITARVRYVSTTVEADYQGDRDNFALTFPGGTIVGPDGKSYTRCVLQPGGAKKIRDAIAMGRGVTSQQFMDVEYTFNCDGG